jgi:tetratricopeptide (TPR) repeat protein
VDWYRRHDRTEEAIARLREGVDAVPERVDFRLQLGQLLVEAGRVEEARAAYESVLARRRRHLGALKGMTGIALDQGDLEEAARFLERAEKADPRDAEVRTLRGRLEAALRDSR